MSTSTAQEAAFGPVVAEVLGPPGAGKSTLLAAICRQSSDIAPITGYRGLRSVPAYARAGVSVAPLVRRQARAAPDLSKRLNWMIRLEASRHVLERRTPPGASAVLFDQGPAYTLVRLLQPPSAASEPFLRWWQRMAVRWQELLHVLVVVDAPDEVLLDRVHAREKSHALNELPRQQANAAVAEYRARCETVARALGVAGGPVVLRLDTSEGSLDEHVTTLLDALGVQWDRGGVR